MPGWIVFPKWVADGAQLVSPRSQREAFLSLVRHSFNCRLLGREGFRACSSLAKRAAAYDFHYSRLEDAVALFERMAAAASSGPQVN
jgi:hypothetical protein